MKNLIMGFEQFVNESSSDFSITTVRETLLRNKQKIMVEAGVSERVFDRVLDKMTSDRPESIDEIDLINDAIAHALTIQPSVEAEEAWEEQADGYAKDIPQFDFEN